MEGWWVDLEKGDTAATRALLNLSARPKETVAFLKKKMKPLTISSGQVKSLLLKLGNANESVWKPAFEELSRKWPPAIPTRTRAGWPRKH